MSRARFYDVSTDPAGRPLTGVTVTVYTTGTVTLLPETIYAAASGGATRTNPFVTSTGVVDFFLEDPAVVDVKYTLTGYGTQTQTVEVVEATPPATAVTVTPVGGLVATTAQAALAELDADLTAHDVNPAAHSGAISDAVDAHEVDAAGHVGTYVPLSGSKTVAGQTIFEGATYFKGQVPWIDIRAYGALADDATDNTAAIQAAIDALDANGGVIFIPGGTYQTDTLTCRSDVIFQGVASGSSTNTSRTVSRLKLKNGANGALFTVPDTVHSVTFRNLRMEGNSANQSGTSHGVDIVDGASAFDTWVSVEHCLIRDFLSDGIYSGTNRRALNVTTSYVFSNGRYGVNLKGSDNQLIRTLVGLNTSSGVKIDTASVQRVLACDIFRNAIGVEAVGGAGITGISILHSTVDRNSAQGIYLDVGAASVVQCYLNLNSVVTVGSRHIELRNTATNRFSLVGNTYAQEGVDYAHQVAYDVFFSGTTGPVYERASIIAGAANTAHSNEPGFLNERDPLSWGLVLTIDPRLGFTTNAWPGANRGIFMRCLGGGTISKVGFEVGTASGNVSVAAYRNSGAGLSSVPTGAPIATSGSVACPSTGYAEVSLGASISLNAGDWLFLSCDNTTATFGRHATPTGSNIMLGLIRRQDTAHPAPTVGTLAASAYSPVLIGVA